MKKVIIGLFLVVTLPVSLVAQSQSQNSTEKPPVSDLLYPVIAEEGVEAAIARYREMRAQNESGYDLGEAVINALGYRLLNEGRHEAAIAIFEMNAGTFPGSYNVWDSLAEAYFAIGNRELAEKYYKKELAVLEKAANMPPGYLNYFRNRARQQLFIVQHLDPAAEAELHFTSYFGGPKAGMWDVQNLAAFKEKTGITISYAGNNVYRSPVPANVEATLTGPARPDVLTGLIAGDYRCFIERGIVADITHLWQEESWDEVFPKPFKKMSAYNGKQYFIPMAYQWNPIWYRKDIFGKHGLTPPETWEELLDLCGRLNELGYTPFTIAVQNWPPPVARWFTTLNLRLNGPEFHEQVMRGSVPFSDERLRNVFVHWRELFRHQAFAEDSHNNTYAAAIQQLKSEDAVMYNLGEWLFEGLDPKLAAELDFFPFPEMNPEVTPAEIVHTYGAFMTSGNSNPEASESLLKWLAGKESQQSNVEGVARVVAHKNVDPSFYSGVQKRIVEHVNNTEELVPLFEFNTHPDFAQKALAVFQEFWKNPEDVDGALEKLENARQEVFGPSASTSCMDDPRKRQFDFWVGSWDVFVDGEKASESVIERALGGCLVIEHYTSLRYDYSGKSMNFFDTGLGEWVQIWTDNQGNVSRYTGEWRDGKMYFDGKNINREGTESDVRMEFTPNPDGSVRQLYEQSSDGGKNWKTVFDGIYRAKNG